MTLLYILGVLAAYLILNFEYITSQEKISYDTTNISLVVLYSIVLSFFSWFYVITYCITRRKFLRCLFKLISNKELSGYFG